MKMKCYRQLVRREIDLFLSYLYCRKFWTGRQALVRSARGKAHSSVISKVEANIYNMQRMIDLEERWMLC